MTSQQMMKATAKPGYWFENVAPLGEKPDWRERVAPKRAIEAAKACGATRVQECYPMMRWGVGSNQPRTVAFTCNDDAHAKRVADTYDQELAFVETRERNSRFV